MLPPGGGKQTFSGLVGNTYATEIHSRVVLVRTSLSPIRYERRFPNGGLEVYGQSAAPFRPERCS